MKNLAEDARYAGGGQGFMAEVCFSPDGRVWGELQYEPAGGGADEEDAQAGVELVGFRGGGDRGYSRFLGSAHEGFVEG